MTSELRAMTESNSQRFRAVSVVFWSYRKTIHSIEVQKVSRLILFSFATQRFLTAAELLTSIVESRRSETAEAIRQIQLEKVDRVAAFPATHLGDSLTHTTATDKDMRQPATDPPGSRHRPEPIDLERTSRNSLSFHNEDIEPR
jgi:hypothetical protein